ncbi:MAG: ABC transporter substrate-binding protein [Bdellovibrionales bacterium]|jgi:oligopeptide transport system substrate-binding protein|nr:ABC transporter substrate-binding protein [Bdellovibrionales bacterium]
MKYLILILLFFGCTKKVTNYSKGLDLALSSEASTLDPALSYDGTSAEIVYQGYESLYQYDYETRPYKVVPLLATAMPTISEDKKTYTINIKKNVYFHPDESLPKGRMLIANDFITQIKRLAFIPTKSPGWWLFDNKIVGLNKARQLAGNNLEKLLSTNIEGIVALDKHTIQIKLIRPYPQLIYALCMSFTSPIPQESVTFYKNNLTNKIIGTGPFVLERFNPIGNTYLTRFALYHAKKPHVEKIQFHLLKETQTRWLNFLSGKIDITRVDADNFQNVVDENQQLNEELEDKGIELIKEPTLTYWWLAFNMNDPVVGKNLKLRKAIAHAIDRDKFIQLFTNNVAKKANSIIPPGIEGHDPDRNPPFEYNIEKAKKLLKQGRILVPLTLKFDVRNTSTKARQMAEFFKKELKKIGIEIKISQNTFPAFLEKLRKGDLQFWMDGWAMDYPDPENSLTLLSKKSFPPGPNASFYSNPRFEKILNKTLLESNPEKKLDLISKLEDIVSRDMPWIMLYYDNHYILKYQKLENYLSSSLIQNKYKYLELK